MATGLQKLETHIRALELKYRKVELLLKEENQKLAPNPARIADIEKAGVKIREQIAKIEASISKARAIRGTPQV
jgi:hypothetical protein